MSALQFDARSLEEITAECDAGRPEKESPIDLWQIATQLKHSPLTLTLTPCIDSVYCVMSALQFDARTLEEITAERDAGRPEEDLAARTMRDEGMFHYGNQPIRYDPWDLGEDWVPPAIAAAAEGKLYPDVRELQAREDAKQQAKRDALLDR
jgi:hypothetical protein